MILCVGDVEGRKSVTRLPSESRKPVQENERGVLHGGIFISHCRLSSRWVRGYELNRHFRGYFPGISRKCLCNCNCGSGSMSMWHDRSS